MIFMLSVEQARRVAGVAKAASGDASRPLLQQMQVTWRPRGGDDPLEWAITFTATNSYMMVRRTVFTRRVDEATSDHSALVPAKAFGKMLKDAAGAAKGKGPRLSIGVSLDSEARQFEVATYPSEDFGAIAKMEMTPQSNKYPETESIFGDRSRTYEGPLPAFNPRYLKALMDSISSTPSDVEALPARWFATKAKGAELSAWGFRVEDATNETDFEGLLMPIRL